MYIVENILMVYESKYIKLFYDLLSVILTDNMARRGIALKLSTLDRTSLCLLK